ncbi:MAG: hypothetical protein ACI8Z0_002049 [Lentimonas sp.]|jgi:hypothetical protein
MARVRNDIKAARRQQEPYAYLQRFILTQLREASDPLSARQIADAWVIDQMIDGDTDTLRLLRRLWTH